jgi:hypothetical protein
VVHPVWHGRSDATVGNEQIIAELTTEPLWRLPALLCDLQERSSIPVQRVVADGLWVFGQVASAVF